MGLFDSARQNLLHARDSFCGIARAARRTTFGFKIVIITRQRGSAEPYCKGYVIRAMQCSAAYLKRWSLALRWRQTCQPEDTKTDTSLYVRHFNKQRDLHPFVKHTNCVIFLSKFLLVELPMAQFCASFKIGCCSGTLEGLFSSNTPNFSWLEVIHSNHNFRMAKYIGQKLPMDDSKSRYWQCEW